VQHHHSASGVTLKEQKGEGGAMRAEGPHGSPEKKKGGSLKEQEGQGRVVIGVHQPKATPSDEKACHEARKRAIMHQ
jgi:hypothetical protein